MFTPAVARLTLLVALAVTTQAVGCRISVPGRDTRLLGTAAPTRPATAAPGEPVGTALPPAAGATAPRPGAGEPVDTPSPVTATATTTATLPAAPPPGTPVSARVWHSLVKAPGLPDMSPAGDLGPNTRLVLMTGNNALNTLRADMGQPSNAWVSGVATDTLLVAAFLGVRAGDGHDVEITGLSLDGNTVNLAVRAVAPGEWLGGGVVYPLHLIALERAALPAGPVTFRFLDADAVADPRVPAAFDVSLDPVDLNEDILAQKDVLILQTASEATPTP